MPGGRPAKKDKDNHKAQQARSGKITTARAQPVRKENAPPTPTNGLQASSKRKRSNSENLHYWHCKQKAEHETVKRRDTALKEVRTELVQVRSSLTFAESTSANLQDSNTGLLARLTTVCNSLDAQTELYTTTCSQLDTAQRQLIARDGQIAQLEKQTSDIGQKMAVLQQELDKIVRRHKTRERRAVLNASKKSIQRHAFVLREGKRGGGAIPIDVRLAILELTVAGVSSANVYRVIRICSGLFDVEIRGTFTEASVRSIILQAGVAGSLQLGDAMLKTPCVFILSTIH
jgi:molecular chaperone GrpE (heat shock protein)